MLTATARQAAKTVVGIGDARFIDRPGTLVTYALGSCLGVVAMDATAGVAGLVHIMLPEARTSPEKAKANPWLFVDTALPLFFSELQRRGARRETTLVKAAGGASLNGTMKSDLFQIGKKNFTVLRRMLFQYGILLRGQDVGGTGSRTLSVEWPEGVCWIHSGGATQRL